MIWGHQHLIDLHRAVPLRSIILPRSRGSSSTLAFCWTADIGRSGTDY